MFGRKSRRSSVIRTLIGDNTRIQGDLCFESGCHVDGLVDGSVTGGNDPDAYLSVSENGKIKGNVKVPRLGLSGTVEGDVVVTERAEFGPTARVTGNVHYNLIEIAAGAEINGKLIHVSEAPARAKAPAASRTAAKADADDQEFEAAAKQPG